MASGSSSNLSTSVPWNFANTDLTLNFSDDNSNSPAPSELQLSASLPTSESLSRLAVSRRNRRRLTRPLRSGSGSMGHSKAAQSQSRIGTSKTALPAPLPIMKYSDVLRNDAPTMTKISKALASWPVDLDDDSDDERWRGNLGRWLHNPYLSWRDSDTNHALSSLPTSAILLIRDPPSYANSADLNSLVDRVRFLPLCQASSIPGRNYCVELDLTIIPPHRERIDHTDENPPPSNATWPPNDIPVELFGQITQYLARNDVKSMRLVNHEFERKVSRSLFYTSVVPFNTEIYDMIDECTKFGSRSSLPSERDQHESASGSDTPQNALLDPASGGLQWQNAKEDKDGKVYRGHGLRVFQGFGPHIKRFGMSFDVSESQLSNPPEKKELDCYNSYYGGYDWPQPQYARFANLAGLERTADETSKMRAAFSNLKIVQELALSLDSGLGWLNGPDKSLRGRIFEMPTSVFHTSSNKTDRPIQEAEEFWSAMKWCAASSNTNYNEKEVRLEFQRLPNPNVSMPSDLAGLSGLKYANSSLWSGIELERIVPNATLMNGANMGVLAVTSSHKDTPLTYEKYPLIPSDLRKEQKEWLLETEWAQRAFLESYMLAVTDNPSIFSQVTTLKFAKVSSRYLPLLARNTFWGALPCLADVTLHISADWRIVVKDEAGFAHMKTIDPSSAVLCFHKNVLSDLVAHRKSIKKLDIGWSGGGENAEGIFARNANLLPAPISELRYTMFKSDDCLIDFRYVEHLTLTNCWMTPAAVEGLVKQHRHRALKRLTLDSVSLTAYPSFQVDRGPFESSQSLPVAVWARGLSGWNPRERLVPLRVGNAAQGQPFNVPIPQPWQAPLHNNFHVNGNVNPQQWANNLQNTWMGPMPPPPPTLPQLANGLPGSNDNPPSHWTQDHREGSWPDLLNKISPGATLSDFIPPTHPFHQTQKPPRRPTKLRTIELKSCGYARIQQAPSEVLDQSPFATIEAAHHVPSHWFRARAVALKSAMLETRDRYIGAIVQGMPQRELDCVLMAWGLKPGWEESERAERGTFDGFLPGGSGRISGVVSRSTDAAILSD